MAAWTRPLVAVLASLSLVHCQLPLPDSTVLVQHGFEAKSLSDPETASDTLAETNKKVESEESSQDQADAAKPENKTKKVHKKLGERFFGPVVNRIQKAIADVREKFETKAAEVVRKASEDMKAVGDQMNNDFKATVQNAVKAQLQKSNQTSLLDTGLGGLEQPETNETHKKRHFNPFNMKELVSSIDKAMVPVSENIAMSTRVLIHDTTDELQKIGDKLKENLKETVRSQIGDVEAEMHHQTEKN